MSIDTAHTLPPAPFATPDELSYDLARRAHNGTSFVPEKRAKQEQEGYAAAANAFHEEASALAHTPEQQAILADELARYKANYLKHYTAYLASHSNVVSTMIAGPANFPAARMNKRSEWAHNKLTAFLEWKKSAEAAIRRRLMDARPAELKEGEDWMRLRMRIESSLSTIRAIDDGREPFSRAAFTNSIAGRVERLAANGQVEMVERAVELVREYNAANKKPALSSRHKFWGYVELARRVAAIRAEKLAAVQAECDAAGAALPATAAILKTESAEVIRNAAEDRVQIVFDGKPDEALRSRLKGEGWRWAPSQGAWQRKLTQNAVASAKRIVGAA